LEKVLHEIKTKQKIMEKDRKGARPAGFPEL
jgi:hypothetical protein